MCEEFEMLSGVEKLDASLFVIVNTVADLCSVDSIVSTFFFLKPSSNCSFGGLVNALPPHFFPLKRNRNCMM